MLSTSVISHTGIDGKEQRNNRRSGKSQTGTESANTEAGDRETF